MPNTNISTTLPRLGQTYRRDPWWVSPALVFTVLSSFVIYTTWAAYQGAHYAYQGYLSPLYSPELWGDSPHAWFGPKPGWWPAWLPFSPALLILWAPGLFRLTCYYYRGAYYKAFFLDPPSCSVSESKKRYTGERSFPLFLQNVHRYFVFIALGFLVILTWDVWKGMWFTDPVTKKETFGIGVGTIVMAVNVFLLGSYATGCHSLRHVVGGMLDQLSRRPARFLAYRCVTCFNKKHMLWAWLSLFSVAFTDIYIRLCSMGVWTDFRIL